MLQIRLTCLLPLDLGMTTPSPYSIVLASSLISLALFVPGCSDSSSSTNTPAPEFEADTSYLDDLETAVDETIDDAQELTEDIVEEPIDQKVVERVKEYKDEVREWTLDTGSKSLLGKARDRARDITKQAQNSTVPENGLALTQFDEEYAQAAGFAWDMPEDWRMAIPGTGRFAEMYVLNQLGNASVSFTKETESASQIKRTLESYFTDRPNTRSSTDVVMDYPVTYFDLSGTYVDPAQRGVENEKPFYAIHAAVIELPTTKVLIKLWGPSDTVEQSKGKIDAMINNMYER